MIFQEPPFTRPVLPRFVSRSTAWEKLRHRVCWNEAKARKIVLLRSRLSRNWWSGNRQRSLLDPASIRNSSGVTDRDRDKVGARSISSSDFHAHLGFILKLYFEPSPHHSF